MRVAYVTFYYTCDIKREILMREIFDNSEKDYLKFVCTLLSLLCFTLFILGCFHNRGHTLPPEILGKIKDVAAEKELAKTEVVDLKKYYKPNSKVYTEGKELYVTAMAAVNGWIEGFKFELRTGSTSPPAEHEKSLAEAAEKSKTFINYVRKLPKMLPPGEGEMQAEAILPSFGGLLFDGLMQLWRESRAADKEKREEIIKALDELKWPPFDDIFVAIPA